LIINDLTYPEIDDYISQIWYVSPMSRIRYYLRDIKNVLFGMFTEGYEPDAELDEGETKEDRRKTEFESLQNECEDSGLIPPEDDG
jgi:hypothetical protein